MRLNYFKIFPWVLVILLTGTACEKVIDVQLKDVEKKYVIEGIITNNGKAKVIITQTGNVSDPLVFNGVTNASVTITPTGMAAQTLQATSAGIYEATFLVPAERNYTLQVSIGGQQFSASCYMPAQVPVDTVFTTTEQFIGDPQILPNILYSDPVKPGNAYKQALWVNGVKIRQIYISNDEYSNGRQCNDRLYIIPDEDEDNSTIPVIQPGDTLTIEMNCIDPVIYKYWFSLQRSALGSNEQATPANPVSNIQGGALGYFSAHTIETITYKVPQ